MEDVSTTKLTVKIYKAKEVVWEGYAVSVSSTNAQGPFDVLPMHQSFITLVQGHPIKIVTPQGTTVTHQFPVSVIHVTKNTVTVYADIRK